MEARDYEKVIIDKGADISALLGALIGKVNNGGGGGQCGDWAKYFLASANRGEDDYFKWIILLAILRGGFFGENGLGECSSEQLQQIQNSLTSIKDNIFASTTSLSDREQQTQNLIQHAESMLQQCCCQTQAKVAEVESAVQADGNLTRTALCGVESALQREACDTRGAVSSAQNAICSQIASISASLDKTCCEVLRAIDRCCCETQGVVRDGFSAQQTILNQGFNTVNANICDLGNRMGMGFANVDKQICQQTNDLLVAGTANTQRILDGQQRLYDTMQDNRIRELEAQNTQLKNEAIAQQQTLALDARFDRLNQLVWKCCCCDPCGSHHHGGGGGRGGNGGPPWGVANGGS